MRSYADYALFFILDLASVHPNAHLDLEFLQGLANGTGAADCAGRSIEGREEAVSGCLHLVSSVVGKLPADEHPVLDQDIAIVAVAQRHQAFSGTSDVSDQDGRQHPFPRGARPQPCASIEGLQRWEVGWQPRDKELEDAFRAWQALQTVCAEVSQAQLIEQGILDDRGSRRGEAPLP